MRDYKMKKFKLIAPPKDGPKILLFDLETAPILGFVWSLWENNVALNQIKSDTHLLSFSAKWLGDPESKIMYFDQRDAKNVEDDKKLLEYLWELIDQADVTITQNGVKFDHKRLNARFILNGMKPPSNCRKIDTMQLAKRHFAFTSNKLEYLSNNLCKSFKKLKTKKFQGFELWKACLSGNIQAWNEMRDYNKMDVLALEELYKKLAPWDNTVNLSAYSVALGKDYVCSCGNKSFQSKGLRYTNSGVYQRRVCKSCGKEHRSLKNLFTKEQKEKIKG